MICSSFKLTASIVAPPYSVTRKVTVAPIAALEWVAVWQDAPGLLTGRVTHRFLDALARRVAELVVECVARASRP